MQDLEKKRAAARAVALAYAGSLTAEEDAAIRAAALTDPDNPPLTDEQLARMKPVSGEQAIVLRLRARGRPPAEAPKEQLTLRLDRDVVAAFRASGPGWQSRMNEVLREHMPAEQRQPVTEG